MAFCSPVGPSALLLRPHTSLPTRLFTSRDSYGGMFLGYLHFLHGISHTHTYTYMYMYTHVQLYIMVLSFFFFLNKIGPQRLIAGSKGFLSFFLMAIGAAYGSS